MPLGHELATLDRPAQGRNAEYRDAAEDRVRYAKLGQPGRGLKIERRILVRAGRDLATSVEKLADDEVVSRHAATVLYSLVTVNGLRRTLDCVGQG